MKGINNLVYVLKTDLMRTLEGIEVSKIISFPFRDKTLKLSFSPFSRFSKFLTPYPIEIISNELLSNCRFSASPFFRTILFVKSLF